MNITTYRTMIAVAGLAAVLVVADSATAQDDDIFAPVLIGVQRDGESGRVRVRLPFIRVDTGPGGTRVRAPFVRYRSRRYSYPYAATAAGIPPHPESLGTVRVQLDSKVRVVIPERRMPARLTDGADPRLPAPPKPDEAPRVELGKPEPEPADAPPKAEPEKKPAPDEPVSPRESPKTAKRRPVAKPVPPSYLIIPVAASAPLPEVRVAIHQADQAPVPAVQPGPSPPKPEAAPAAADTPKPTTSGKTVYDLVPIWHTEVTQVFQPAAGVHLFAFIHPRTQRVVSVQVVLPEGRPRIKLKRDEIEFDYGRYEVEIDFKRDGRVVIDYQNKR